MATVRVTSDAEPRMMPPPVPDGLVDQNASQSPSIFPTQSTAAGKLYQRGSECQDCERRNEMIVSARETH